MENTNNIRLDELREQAELLKSKLDKETIVSEALLRKTVKRKASTINRIAWISFIASIFVILCTIFLFPKEGFSLFFCIATALMVLVCDFFTWKYHKNINRQTLNDDLLTVAKTMKNLKSNYLKWRNYTIVMLIIWVSWYCTEYVLLSSDWKHAAASIVSILIGGAIGTYIGLKMDKKVVTTADEIIRQIEQE